MPTTHGVLCFTVGKCEYFTHIFMIVQLAKNTILSSYIHVKK